MTISAHLFEVCLKSPTKGWLRSAADPTTGNSYAAWVAAQNEEYHAAGGHGQNHTMNCESLTDGRASQSSRVFTFHIRTLLDAATRKPTKGLAVGRT
jgi:hypothetical protein